ncbi:MAG: hypothetical protein AVDCRST_MAG06-3405 [uncultured Nocardioides sp.]|uniref:Uncharacterized protein n=1 Tax=uncultured Nocardioides sp. TaxID=198441 RepID=A0A6J4PT67_9ACTN|nr:MAG: hypothetical protein AVDCRST_MAG06-3405 [uncultured Nocardioides sp.]
MTAVTTVCFAFGWGVEEVRESSSGVAVRVSPRTP